MTGSDLAHRPGLSALSNLMHHLHDLCPGLCAIVAQYRQDDVLGCAMSTFPYRPRCTVSKISSLALELFEEVAWKLQPYPAGSS